MTNIGKVIGRSNLQYFVTSSALRVPGLKGLAFIFLSKAVTPTEVFQLCL